jgi:Rap1a immunity proteins
MKRSSYFTFLPVPVLLALAWPHPALADSFTGTSLKRFCSDSDHGSTRDTACNAYIRGIAEGLYVAQLASMAGHYFCPPDDISPTRERQTVEQYMKDHADQLEGAAANLAGAALLQAFPCGNGN